MDFKKVTTILFLGILTSATTVAQNLGTGLYTFGSYDNKGVDAINLGNLNAHFEFPIVRKKGRGLDFGYSLVYESSIWSPVSSAGGTYWQPDSTWGFRGQPQGGVTGSLNFSQVSIGTCTAAGQTFPYYKRTNYVFQDPLGGNHLFNYSETESRDSGNGCALAVTPSGDGTTLDNSGYAYQSATKLVTTRSGLTINPYVSGSTQTSITDANGNVISSNAAAFTDTTGSTELTISGAGSPSSPLVLTYPVAAQSDGSTTAAVTVYYKTYTVSTAFQCPSIGEYTSTASLVDSIVYPDASHSTYHFSYEPTPGSSNGSVTGRLASVMLPTGGSISYAYSGGCNNSGIYADGTPATIVRTTSDGVKSYTRTFVSGSATSATTVLDEGGNRTDLTFENSTNGLWYETERKVYTGGTASGNPLLDRTTLYNGQTTVGQISGRPMKTDVYEVYDWLNANANSDPNQGQLHTTNLYTATGLLTSSTQSTIGGSTIASAQRAYNGNDEVTSATTYDPTGKLVSSTTYGYDETAPTQTGSIPQHSDVVTGPRGNRTSVHVLTSTGNTLDTTFQNFDTGQVQTTTTPNGVTALAYESTNTFPTLTTLPIPSSGATLATSGIFDKTSGAQLTRSGMNGGQITTLQQYDPLLRPTIVTYPQAGAQKTTTYTPNQTTVSSTMDGSHSTNRITIRDGYGRTIRSAVWNGSVYYITDSCYGFNGLTSSVGVTYTSSALPGTYNCANGTSFTYDGLGRKTRATRADGSSTTWTYTARAVKQADSPGTAKITQTDPIGRTTAICELSSSNNVVGNTPAACNLNIAGTGFLTTYAYDMANHKVTVTQGAQTRVFQTDAAGRSILTQEPERGKTTYSYAYNSNGLAVTRFRPRANQTNPGVTTSTVTQYDKVGRVISITYNDGNTPTKTFIYDQNGNGGTISNMGSSKGKLTTMTAGSTGRAYAYDIMGRISETSECPGDFCSGGTNKNAYRWYGYDYLGDITSEQYSTVAGGQSPITLNYAYNQAKQLMSMSGGQNDSAGDLYTAMAPTMQPFGPTTVMFGNGLSTTSQYDSMGRLNAQDLCAGTPGVGCPSGTGYYRYGFMNQQQGNQVQSSWDMVVNRYSDFTYDDMGRLTSAQSHTGSLGITMNSTFDRYGNRWAETITNSGGATDPNTSFAYDPATNHNTSFAYDAAGNMMNDAVHGYQYDAEGNLLLIDNGSTASYVYNALNQRTQATAGGATDRYGLDLNGRRVTHWDPNGNLTLTQYYRGRDRMAHWTASDGHIHFEHTDWTGTARMRTSWNGTDTDGTYTSMPYGEMVASTGTDLVPSHYAVLDQDLSASAGLSHAALREYSAIQGHWTSPDPSDASYDGTDPQSMNRYSYAANNPLVYIDPDGTTVSSCEASGAICYDAGGNAYAVSSDGALSGNTVTVNVNADGSSSATQGNGGVLPGSGFSGGSYTYAGAEVGVGPINGFEGYITETSNPVGSYVGTLTEITYGEGLVIGGGFIVPPGGTPQPIDFSGLGGHIGNVGFSGGIVAGPGFVGIYYEYSTGYKAGGGGYYVNTP